MRAGSLCALAFAATCAVPALAAFKCIDEKGRTHIEDTPPAACENVVTYEISRSGTVLRKIEPAGANAHAKEDKDKAAEAAKTAAEQKRRDRALLDSYSSEREINATRDRNVEMLKTRLSAAREVLHKAETREQQAQAMVDKAGKTPPAQPKAGSSASRRCDRASR
jgi:hypothetical protein